MTNAKIWRRQSHVERLAETDTLFRDNYRALVANHTADSGIKERVTHSLIANHYARVAKEKRDARIIRVNFHRGEQIERKLAA